MDKLVEWGTAAHHNGKCLIEQEYDAITPFGLIGAIGTIVGSLIRYNPPWFQGQSNYLNDVEVSKRVCAPAFSSLLLIASISILLFNQVTMKLIDMLSNNRRN
jgi:hypothetical protein